MYVRQETHNRKISTILILRALLPPSGLSLAVENPTSRDGEKLDVLERNPSVAAGEVSVHRRSLQYALKIELDRRFAWPL